MIRGESQREGLIRRLAKGSGLLLTVEGFNQLCSFARNIILARALTKADFGVAATFGIVASLLEISGKMAFSSKVVQASEDEGVRLGDIHAFQLLCSCLSAGLMFGCAVPLAAALGSAELGPALRVLALSVGIEGLRHLGIYRHARHLRYGRIALAEALPQLAITLAAWPLCVWLGNYRVILWLLVAKSVAGVLLSHFLAGEPFRCRFNRVAMRDIFGFGFPLYLSGLVFAMNSQGERSLVAGFYNLSDLGSYAVAVSLVFAPAYALSRVTSALALPLLAQARGSAAQFHRRYRVCGRVLCVLGAAFALAFFAGGEPAAVAAFGRRYAGAGPVISWLALGMGLRIANGATITSAVAANDTVNLLACNLFRLGGIAAAFVPAICHADLQWIAAAGALFELVSLGGAAWMLHRRQGVPVGEAILMNLAVFSLIAGMLVINQAFAATFLPRLAALAALAAALFLILRRFAVLAELSECLPMLTARAWEKITRRRPLNDASTL